MNNDIHKLEKVMKALANRRRLSILKFLRTSREMPVWEIAQKIHLSRKATSKHLIILTAANVLDKEQRSLEVYYSIRKDTDDVVKHIISSL